MESISDVVDEVIQNCPIDVRRPLYKVWSFCYKINLIAKDQRHHHEAFIYGMRSYNFPQYDKYELWIEIDKLGAASEWGVLGSCCFYFWKKDYL